tara:strand:- start:42331 stop:42519 length:189 start_codon:yes stop_codon:yes gene_type:complete
LWHILQKVVVGKVVFSFVELGLKSFKLLDLFSWFKGTKNKREIENSLSQYAIKSATFKVGIA